MFPWIQNWLDSHGDIDNLPDGAYWAMHVEATDEFVKVYNSKKSKNPRRHRKIDIDWYDINAAFIEWQNKNTSHLRNRRPPNDRNYGFGFTWYRSVSSRYIEYGIDNYDKNKIIWYQKFRIDKRTPRALISHQIRNARKLLRVSIQIANDEVSL